MSKKAIEMTSVIVENDFYQPFICLQNTQSHQFGFLYLTGCMFIVDFSSVACLKSFIFTVSGMLQT